MKMNFIFAEEVPIESVEGGVPSHALYAISFNSHVTYKFRLKWKFFFAIMQKKQRMLRLITF